MARLPRGDAQSYGPGADSLEHPSKITLPERAHPLVKLYFLLKRAKGYEPPTPTSAGLGSMAGIGHAVFQRQ
jgi:hypothetical protein